MPKTIAPAKPPTFPACTVCGSREHPWDAHRCLRCAAIEHNTEEHLARDEEEALKRRLDAEAFAEALTRAQVTDPSIARVTRPRAVRAAMVAIDAGADWLDQDHSGLGRRKHLRLCREGVLPCRKDGKQRLVRRADIDAHIMRNTTPGKPSDVDAVDRELGAFADVVEGGSR